MGAGAWCMVKNMFKYLLTLNLFRVSENETLYFTSELLKINLPNFLLMIISLQNSIDEIAKLLNGQKHLEGRYEELVMTDKNSSELSSLKQNMKSSAQAIMKSVKLNPLATENLIKLQQDRSVTNY